MSHLFCRAYPCLSLLKRNAPSIDCERFCLLLPLPVYNLDFLSMCRYAPEHLIINTADSKDWVKDIINAGSVFLGPWAPVTVGDYASGTNHTLPTYGYARMYSGVSLDSFQKHMTVQYLSQEGLQNIGPAVSRMAEVEGLEAHRKSITVRLQ